MFRDIHIYKSPVTVLVKRFKYSMITLLMKIIVYFSIEYLCTKKYYFENFDIVFFYTITIGATSVKDRYVTTQEIAV